MCLDTLSAHQVARPPATGPAGSRPPGHGPGLADQAGRHQVQGPRPTVQGARSRPAGARYPGHQDTVDRARLAARFNDGQKGAITHKKVTNGRSLVRYPGTKNPARGRVQGGETGALSRDTCSAG